MEKRRIKWCSQEIFPFIHLLYKLLVKKYNFIFHLTQIIYCLFKLYDELWCNTTAGPYLAEDIIGLYSHNNFPIIKEYKYLGCRADVFLLLLNIGSDDWYVTTITNYNYLLATHDLIVVLILSNYIQCLLML